MTQSLYSAITGITCSQSKIDVVANNIANMNTTAYKSSNLNFCDLYARTLQAGSAPTESVGGTNPLQIGLGVCMSGISKDFTNGSIESTGNTNDLNIQGNGWFTLLNSDGTMGLTRDGTFQIDENGDLVTQAGLRVLGTDNAYSLTGGRTTNVHIPNTLNLSISGKDLTGVGGTISELNNASITLGTLSFDVYDTGAVKIGGITGVDISSATTLKDVADTINTALGGVTVGDPASGVTLADLVTAKANSDGTFTVVANDNTQVGAIDFATSGDTSNFLYETGLAVSAFSDNGDGTSQYTSKVLSYMVDIGPATGNDSTCSKASYAVTETGAVEATYSNGDTITVEEKNGIMVLKYITGEGKEIDYNDIKVTGGAITAANLQLQLAMVQNEQGLVARSGNLYTTGANCGEVTYSIGNANGFGAIGSGGLEASNVNLATELANMIVAQRAVDANSRVFSATSEVLQKLVNLQ